MSACNILKSLSFHSIRISPLSVRVVLVISFPRLIFSSAAFLHSSIAHSNFYLFVRSISHISYIFLLAKMGDRNGAHTRERERANHLAFNLFKSLWQRQDKQIWLKWRKGWEREEEENANESDAHSWEMKGAQNSHKLLEIDISPKRCVLTKR